MIFFGAGILGGGGGGVPRGVGQVSYSRGDYMVIVMLSCGRSDVHLCVKCYYAYRVLSILLN